MWKTSVYTREKEGNSVQKLAEFHLKFGPLWSGMIFLGLASLKTRVTKSRLICIHLEKQKLPHENTVQYQFSLLMVAV